MNVTNQLPANYGSGILREAIEIMSCPRSEATHFAICHNSHIKFLLNLQSGIPYLRKTVAAYNKKLALLLKLLPCIPTRLLQAAGFGYFARISLHPSIQAVIPPDQKWNVLVGTYDSAQKLVFQCYAGKNTPCTYIKIGNQGSAEQMEREILFLKKSQSYQSFEIPHLKYSELISEGAPFNIQVTDEFQGSRIQPVLNEEIIRIAKEIAGPSVLVDGTPHTFSHGDFAPWNIRKTGATYTVFDWEHCGMRPEGYDMAYFLIMSQIALNKRTFDEAYDIAITQILKFDSQIRFNKEQIYREFIKTTKTLQF
ncbi:MAG: phosphotransferase [Akkermansia sp.]|nr:phosphotransferase [Akkermansia sp.]